MIMCTILLCSLYNERVPSAHFRPTDLPPYSFAISDTLSTSLYPYVVDWYQSFHSLQLGHGCWGHPRVSTSSNSSSYSNVNNRGSQRWQCCIVVYPCGLIVEFSALAAGLYFPLGLLSIRATSIINRFTIHHLIVGLIDEYYYLCHHPLHWHSIIIIALFVYGEDHRSRFHENHTLPFELTLGALQEEIHNPAD